MCPENCATDGCFALCAVCQPPRGVRGGLELGEINTCSTARGWCVQNSQISSNSLRSWRHEMKTKSKAVGTKEEPVWSSFWVQTWTVILMEKILFFKNSISLLSKGEYESMARSFMLAPPTPGPWNMGPFTSPHPWGHQDVHWYFMSLAIQMARTISLSLLTHHVSGLNLNDHPASLIVILNTISFPP